MPYNKQTGEMWLVIPRGFSKKKRKGPWTPPKDFDRLVSLMLTNWGGWADYPELERFRSQGPEHETQLDIVEDKATSGLRSDLNKALRALAATDGEKAYKAVQRRVRQRAMVARRR